ncbi:MAG: hypothetical protein K9J37_22365 [Saprospiraceae bacterium]|nr:hypothetical protein [Saprospiraceae bacterium]MCF8252668.1 hypothetical protein [Saprospiraceae bacterium]MCF8282867.1 hypothetical protein [Bacteroidales bacterium]MCF8314240.1 hypothetical protein [Saprospiraceae bacterium]MCF8443041.1 hypothetical protein [Saprospiraceae bacterium]
MLANSIAKPETFKEATEDLVNTISDAIRKDELTATDKEWLISELDELIEGLKTAKAKQTPKTTFPKKDVRAAAK